jgi:hypothetical protein
MDGPMYSMCVVNKIRNTPRALPRQIYEHYYKSIQAKQIEEIKILQPVLDLFEHEIRKINIVTNDQTEQAYIRQTTEMLQKMVGDIRENHAKSGAVFLSALETVLKHKC